MTVKGSQKVATGGFIQPLDSCCCGFSLDVSIKWILMIHSCTSFFYIFTCVSNIVLERPTMGSTVSLYTQTFNCAWALASFVFIASGISGVRYHVETHLRVYLYWLMATVFMDLVLTGVYLNKTMCNKLPEFLAASGKAFACGSARVVGIGFMAMCFGFALYAIFVVWSRCQELEESGSEPSFDTLISESRKKQQKGLFEHKSGLFGTGTALSAAYPLMYSSVNTPGIGGGSRIFNGTTHITDFPPAFSPHYTKS